MSQEQRISRRPEIFKLRMSCMVWHSGELGTQERRGHQQDDPKTEQGLGIVLVVMWYKERKLDQGKSDRRGWVNYPDKLGLPQVLQKCVTANSSMDSMGFKIVPFPWGNPSHPLEFAQQDGRHLIWKDQPHCQRGDCLWARHCCRGECDGPLFSPIPALLWISWLIPLQHCCTANMRAQDIT